MKSKDVYYQYCYGWSDGAGSKPLNQTRSEHMGDGMAEAYCEGYADGQKSRRDAHIAAAESFGVEPLIITTLKP